MPFYKDQLYWLMDRKTREYLIGVCTDAAGKFKLSESEPEVDTNKVKPIGSIVHPLVYYVGEEESERWTQSKGF